MRLIIALTLLLLSSCSGGGGTTTGNPLRITLQVVDQQPFAWWKPIKDRFTIPLAHAAVSNVFFCFKRLRFKPDESGTFSENFDLALGRVSIDPNGTGLGSFQVPGGRYERIELDFDKECDEVANRPSVEFTNGNAPFNHSTLDDITIKFEGSFIVTEDVTISLNIDPILDRMDTIVSTDDIKNELENVLGDFEDD